MKMHFGTYAEVHFYAMMKKTKRVIIMEKEHKTTKKIAITIGLMLITGVMIMGLFGCAFGRGNDNNDSGTRKRGSITGTMGPDITWGYDKSTKTLKISGSGEMVSEEQFPWKDLKIKKVVFSDNITSICKNCFYSHSDFPPNLRGSKTLLFTDAKASKAIL